MRNIINNKQFELIVEKNYKLVYKICFDILKDVNESENISQETFISLYKNIDKYCNLNENALKNLICKIALNKCKDYFKKTEFKLVTSIEEINTKDLSESTLIEEELIKKERQLLIKKAVNQLKSPYREVITEYYLNDLSLDEISYKLGKNKYIIKTQIYRAKKLLKQNLKGGNLIE